MMVKRLKCGMALALFGALLWAVPAWSAQHGESENQKSAAVAAKPAPAKSTVVKAAANPPAVEAVTRVEPVVGHVEEVEGIPPEEALKILMEGNERLVSGKIKSPNRSVQRRGEIAQGQKPLAVVVTCSDSRVPPELLFDQGYGDIFVVRTAGNVVDDVALGSIEYALEHLGAKLVVVLGHTKCGAVKATVDGGEAPGHLPSIIAMIQPAVDAAKEKPGDLMPNAIKANVRSVTQKIIRSVPGFVEKAEDSVVGIVGGVYDIDTGKVKLTYRPML